MQSKLTQFLFHSFIALVVSGLVYGQGDTTIVDAGLLALEKPIEQQLTAGTIHRYRLPVTPDQYVQLSVAQRGINVRVSVYDENGKKVARADRDQTTSGSEKVVFIPTSEGVYRIDVEAGQKNSGSGHYEIFLNALRPPTQEERALEDARLLDDRSHELRDKGSYKEAFAPAEAALKIREKVMGPNDLLVAYSLHDLAVLCDDTGDYARAEPLNLRALEIRQRLLGPDHPDVARSLFNLAWIYLIQQKYDQSESSYRRALEIQEKAFGSEHSEVATTLNDFAILLHRKGEYEKAAEMDARVLSIREKTQGADSTGVAKSLNNLGLDYYMAGDYDKAEPLFKKAVAVWEKALGPDHPEVAIALNNLALVYTNRGDYENAIPLEQRFLAINQKVFGEVHVQIAKGLNNLAFTYEKLGNYEEAEPLFRQALAIREKVFGPNHAEAGEGLNNLAFLLLLRNPDSAEAEPLLLRSLGILEKSLGPEHPKVAAPLVNLAAIYERRGDYLHAEPMYERALSIREKALGPLHPEVGVTLQKLSAFYQKRGDIKRAIELLTRANEIRERDIARTISFGSERQKLSYLSLFNNDIDEALSLHARSAPQDQAALDLAFTTLLQRKGRAVDEMSESFARLRKRSTNADELLFNRLANMRARLASLSLKGPDKDVVPYLAQMKALADETDSLESELSDRSAEFRSQSQPITLRAIQTAIPRNTALVEFAIYRPPTPGSAAHYAAYITTTEGPAKWVELGEATKINTAIESWRNALRDPARRDAGKLGRNLDELVMRPVRSLVGPVERILISPDGQLNLIPFAALVDEHDHYLLERYSLTYLTSGRDLLRLKVARESRRPPVVFAEPSFGDPALIAANNSGTSKGLRSRVDFSRMFFGPLPGVSAEVQQLKTLLPDATFLTREQATKSALEEVHAPSILHIATHGFFLESPNSAAPPTVAATRSESPSSQQLTVTNPLLRSGLALAGANGDQSKGILTAFEAIGLDLWGTKLVVLSACDTGLGEVRNGEGVYGLRRAFVLAGAETQVMSLWQVNDRSTRDLMAGYYRRLLAGAGRGEALRQVQLQMLHASTHNHPYYWASFIQTGEWANLQGKR